MDHPSDEELMAQAQQGDVEPFRALIHRYEKPLFNYLRRLMRDDHLAEDLFQDAFLAVYRNRWKFDLSKAFKPWLYAIATNAARDTLRKRKADVASSLDEAAAEGAPTVALEQLAKPLQALVDEESRARLRQCFEQLPGHFHAVLVLFHYEGMKYREISEVLGVPIGTVKSRLHNALQALLQAYETYPA